MEEADSQLITTQVGGEKKERNEAAQVMRRIVQRALQLTDNPQTDIEPTDVLKRNPDGGWEQKEYSKQLRNPQLYGKKKIEGAVRLLWSHLGETSFIIIKDSDGNLASIRVNKGTTATALSLEERVKVDAGHEEVVIGVVRKKVLSTGKLGVSRKEEYFDEQIVLGGVPGEGADPRVTRGIQVKESDEKSFKRMQNNFATSRSLSELPPLALKDSQEKGDLDIDALKAIENVLNNGTLDDQEMMRAMVRKSALLLTSQEHKDRLARSKDH